jgi:hypothetical protein
VASERTHRGMSQLGHFRPNRPDCQLMSTLHRKRPVPGVPTLLTIAAYRSSAATVRKIASARSPALVLRHARGGHLSIPSRAPPEWIPLRTKGSPTRCRWYIRRRHRGASERPRGWMGHTRSNLKRAATRPTTAAAPAQHQQRRKAAEAAARPIAKKGGEAKVPPLRLRHQLTRGHGKARAISQ